MDEGGADVIEASVFRCGTGDDHRHQRAVQRFGPGSLRLHLLPVQRGAERSGADGRKIHGEHTGA